MKIYNNVKIKLLRMFSCTQCVSSVNVQKCMNVNWFQVGVQSRVFPSFYLN